MQVPLVVRLSVMHTAYSLGAVCPGSQTFQPINSCHPMYTCNVSDVHSIRPVCCTPDRSDLSDPILSASHQDRPATCCGVTMTVTAAVVDVEGLMVQGEG